MLACLRFFAFVLTLIDPQPATSCRTVAHIGDSTSLGMLRGDPGQRLGAQYERVGVRRMVIEAAGGMSLREHRTGRENGVMVARRVRASGFHGCWVIALGTNDAANVARGGGGVPSMSSRVAAMMEVIGDDPVLWVDALTMGDGETWGATGHYAEMGEWNMLLESELGDWRPNAHVYRWSGDAWQRRGWFQADGIHYARAGRVARARLIADALADAFPAVK